MLTRKSVSSLFHLVIHPIRYLTIYVHSYNKYILYVHITISTAGLLSKVKATNSESVPLAEIVGSDLTSVTTLDSLWNVLTLEAFDETANSVLLLIDTIP